MGFLFRRTRVADGGCWKCTALGPCPSSASARHWTRGASSGSLGSRFSVSLPIGTHQSTNGEHRQKGCHVVLASLDTPNRFGSSSLDWAQRLDAAQRRALPADALGPERRAVTMVAANSRDAAEPSSVFLELRAEAEVRSSGAVLVCEGRVFPSKSETQMERSQIF